MPDSAREAAGLPQYRPNYRIATRAISEFITHVGAAMIRGFDGDLDLGALYVALLRQADLASEGAGVPISVNALARSTGRPFETTRRLSNRLGDMGLVERVEGGIQVTGAALGAPVSAVLRATFSDCLVWQIIEMQALGHPMPERAPGTAFDAVVLEQAAYDLLLFTIEFGAASHPRRDWLKAFLYMAIMTANARGFASDPALARRYSEAGTPPPDVLRPSVRVAALARGLGLPYPTVRRNVEILVAQGQVERCPQGYRTSVAYMQRDTSLAAGEQMGQQLVRLLRRIGAAGFPFDAPERAYRVGPPDFIAF